MFDNFSNTINYIVLTAMILSCADSNSTANQTQSNTKTLTHTDSDLMTATILSTDSDSSTNTNSDTQTGTNTNLMTDTTLSTDTDSSTNTNSDTQTDTDQNVISYDDQNISYEEALVQFSNGRRLFNPTPMQIDNTLEDWQILDLTAYAMQVFDFSQQGHFLAIEHYDIDFTNEIDLLSHILTTNLTGFKDTQFQDLINIQDLCSVNPESELTPFETNIFETYNSKDSVQRDAKIRFSLNLSQCHFYNLENEKEYVSFGDLSYGSLVFNNTINSDMSETLNHFSSLPYGKWIVLGKTMGYQESLGYWFIDNFSSQSTYDNTNPNPQVETTNLRTDFYIRDGYLNFDHRYFIKQHSASTIYTHLGATNPYAGSIEISTDHIEGTLIIEFFESAVNIYIDDELHLEDVSWTDIRSRKLDMTFDYAND